MRAEAVGRADTYTVDISEAGPTEEAGHHKMLEFDPCLAVVHHEEEGIDFHTESSVQPEVHLAGAQACVEHLLGDCLFQGYASQMD